MSDYDNKLYELLTEEENFEAVCQIRDLDIEKLKDKIFEDLIIEVKNLIKNIKYDGWEFDENEAEVGISFKKNYDNEYFITMGIWFVDPIFYSGIWTNLTYEKLEKEINLDKIKEDNSYNKYKEFNEKSITDNWVYRSNYLLELDSLRKYKNILNKSDSRKKLVNKFIAEFNKIYKLVSD